MRLFRLGLRALLVLRFPGVRWVRTRTLADWMSAGDGPPLVLLDARGPDEFEVSHLAGAERVDPDAGGPAAVQVSPDARIVVYCSVGYRSARVARRLAAAGFERIYNLDGGIFQWANEGRPLHRGREGANEVHPYDAIWGRLLDARFHPER